VLESQNHDASRYRSAGFLERADAPPNPAAVALALISSRPKPSQYTLSTDWAQL